MKFLRLVYSQIKKTGWCFSFSSFLLFYFLLFTNGYLAKESAACRIIFGNARPHIQAVTFTHGSYQLTHRQALMATKLLFFLSWTNFHNTVGSEQLRQVCCQLWFLVFPDAVEAENSLNYHHHLYFKTHLQHESHVHFNDQPAAKKKKRSMTSSWKEAWMSWE